MLDYHQALAQLLQQLTPIAKVKQLPLIEANGHILAEDLIIQNDAPLFTNSAMDGYAIAGNDCKSWQIIGRIAAGENTEAISLERGEACRIFTGAPMPKGSTAVIIQENSIVTDNLLTTIDIVKDKQNIRQQAEELKKGGILLKAQQRLSPPLLALIASQGYATVPVFSALNISVFSTGNELIEPSQTLKTGKIYDANRFLLISWLKTLGHHVEDGGILPDNQLRTEQALKQATTNSDVIITSGGVSVGEEDHLKAALNHLGNIILWKLAIKPGKPFAWGEIANTKVFMLPGNPVSSLVTFHQLTLPALRILSGEAIATASPQTIQAKACFAIHKTNSRREFLRVKLKIIEADNRAILLNNQGSAMLATFGQANALAEIPPNTVVHEGDLITLYPLNYKA